MTIRVRAPANIALVKYMGKRADQIPENPSISLTLNELCTGIEIDRELGSNFSMIWNATETPSFSVERPWVAPQWTEAAHASALQRMHRAIERIHQHLQAPLRDTWIIRSANTFPAGTGIASSASFFAALTLATCKALLRGSAESAELADLSRRLSGSSARSFFGPWVGWQETQVYPLASRMPRMSDTVVILETQHKEVGSSDAHQRVKTSARWQGRAERASFRAKTMSDALREGDWNTVRTLAFEDSEDMHALFETSQPPFQYRTSASREIMAWAFQSPWIIATMDAGANVHLLTRTEDQPKLRQELAKNFGSSTRVLVDNQGHGPSLL
jgi:diphosphomevalonate decarboxylase